jgi:glycosyltransferase involved in cell wall biosynthesis
MAVQMGKSVTTPWVVCQIGAREHYAIARGLARRGMLDALVTDAWVTPSPFLALAPRLSGRYHPDVPAQAVSAFTLPAIAREGISRLTNSDSTTAVIRRNAWFQARAINALKALERKRPGDRVLFAYSYAAKEILRWAKARGWRTVLGQIDPGPMEEKIVSRLVAKHDPNGRNCVEKPASYWSDWHAEIAVADMVVVNSDWSREALILEGVSPDKIVLVPLAYEGSRKLTSNATCRREGPLRALFLGQAILRKGIAELIEAAGQLTHGDVQIHVVGAASPSIAARMQNVSNLVWHGPQPHSKVEAFYRESDVFIFPTHSDGFGLTQLEAIANGLPIIASTHCGPVVRDGQNGILLEEVSASELASVLSCLARDRNYLAALAQGASTTTIPRPVDIADQLILEIGSRG